MSVLIGTSGWQYRDWRGRFYPADLPQRAWLEHYAKRFHTVEVNNAFYQLPKPETFADWARRTPEHFVVGVKASRYLTHIRRLRDSQEAVARFMSHAGHLGDKLGPVLLQLPPNLRADLVSLDETLGHFGGRVRVAVEFRHDSWFDDEVYECLRRHGAALCLADRGSAPVTPLRATAGWGYVRLHAGRAVPHPCYGRAALASWARRIAARWPGTADVFVFFNNDTLGCAVRDARLFALEAVRAGLAPTRTPAAAETPVG